MTLRTLTLDEMTAQADGTLAVVVFCEDNAPAAGTQLKRRHSFMDDEQSVAYWTGPDFESFDFFEGGEVGVYEAQTMTLPFSVGEVVCAGRTCVDISTGRTTDELVDELGIFRPDLDTRKIGKIRVELVDDGFPLALREVAKVMTWAQTAKGYKDHDWQNLPNAEVALAAAASRHRTDHIKQRVVDGLLIERCVDPESSLLHKAHEAFGVLAQLELMLRGEFDLGLDLPQ